MTPLRLVAIAVTLPAVLLALWGLVHRDPPWTNRPAWLRYELLAWLFAGAVAYHYRDWIWFGIAVLVSFSTVTNLRAVLPAPRPRIEQGEQQR